MLAKIHITYRNGVLDPQGQAIGQALQGMGFTAAGDVRQGKYIEVSLNEPDRAKAEAQVDAMCRRLLANTVIEQYRFELISDA